jgi:hypothetical protein
MVLDRINVLCYKGLFYVEGIPWDTRKCSYELFDQIYRI